MQVGRDRILVTGATGQQGGALARELLARGHKVRAMTRKPDSMAARELAQAGAEVVAGDFDDEASLVRPLLDAWGTFAVQNTWEAGVGKEEVQGKAFAQAAKRAGVRHLVYASVGSAHRNTGIPHFDNKWRIEQTIRSLGFPSFTVVRPVFFLENFLSPWFKQALDAGTLAIGLPPTTKLQMIAIADVGTYHRLAFERHDQLNGRGIDIAGDELTMPETARILGEAARRPITFQSVPIADVRKAGEDYAVMLEWFVKVGYDVNIPALAKEFGVTPTTVKVWAAGVRWSAAG